MRLDEFIPVWQFRERHETQIAATPEKIFDAIRTVRAEDIFLFRTLVAIRRGFRRTGESILNPAPNTPILDVATRTTFDLLVDDPPNEIVIGTHLGPHIFAAANFLVTRDRETPARLSRETRVHARTRRAKWIFGAYWLVIRAGSGFIRRMWLRAIRLRAEHS